MEEKQPAQEPEIINSGGIFKCPKCPFETIYKSKMMQHLQSEKICQICKKYFHGKNAKRSYERHMQEHKKIKIIPICDVCGRLFNCESKVKRHKLGGPCGRA